MISSEAIAELVTKGIAKATELAVEHAPEALEAAEKIADPLVRHVIDETLAAVLAHLQAPAPPLSSFIAVQERVANHEVRIAVLEKKLAAAGVPVP